jgi:LacI family transcriptional regulator
MVPMNLEDIAKIAGVSRSTVSRVINDDSRVSDDVRSRVKGVIALHNYHPNAAARTLASRRSAVIGLLIPEIASTVFTDPWYPILIQGCMDGCQEQDLSLMLLMESSTDPDAANRLIQRTLRAGHLDGVVVATSLVDTAEMRLLAEREFPYVVIGRTPTLESTWVDIDNRAAARNATEHLLGHGRTRPAMIAGPPSIIASIDRVDGFRDAVDEAGLSSTVHYASYNQREAYNVALQLLRSSDPPDAIFASSDVMAVGVIQAARHLGIDVPRQLGVLGFDDIQPDRVAQLGITTVRQPARELGRRAVELLNHRLADPAIPHVHEWFSTDLVLRSSCGCVPVDVSISQPEEPQRKRGDPVPISMT